MVAVTAAKADVVDNEGLDPYQGVRPSAIVYVGKELWNIVVYEPTFNA